MATGSYMTPIYSRSQNSTSSEDDEKSSKDVHTLPLCDSCDLEAEYYASSHNCRKHATRGLLATDNVILNHGQVTWTTPEMAPNLQTTTSHQREDVSALDRFNVHHCPTCLVFSGTGLKLVTRQATIQYLYQSATAATLTC
ncbi:uncharacterized protein TNCV_1117561 [Trichonephila clavipes]|nr:uncharacterized protein TNCV_1117561 [Trichonephila clavipes]